MEARRGRKCLNSVLPHNIVPPFQIGITAIQLTFRQLFTAILRSYNFASPGHLERLNLFRKADLMTEQNNRVLARMGARTLTQAELAEVVGGGTTPILFTETLTNLGRDHFPDERVA